MDIEYDPGKSDKNMRERGLSFEDVLDLEWEKAVIFPDTRRDYGEKRLMAFIPMDGRLYNVCYVPRGQIYRVISFRKANARERRIYDEKAKKALH